jgi:hypothetical protein
MLHCSELKIWLFLLIAKLILFLSKCVMLFELLSQITFDRTQLDLSQASLSTPPVELSQSFNRGQGVTAKVNEDTSINEYLNLAEEKFTFKKAQSVLLPENRSLLNNDLLAGRNYVTIRHEVESAPMAYVSPYAKNSICIGRGYHGNDEDFDSRRNSWGVVYISCYKETKEPGCTYEANATGHHLYLKQNCDEPSTIPVLPLPGGVPLPAPGGVFVPAF